MNDRRKGLDRSERDGHNAGQTVAFPFCGVTARSFGRGADDALLRFSMRFLRAHVLGSDIILACLLATLAAPSLNAAGPSDAPAAKPAVQPAAQPATRFLNQPVTKSEAQPLAQNSQGPIVRAIDIQGLQTVDRRQVLRILPIHEGEPLARLAPGRLINDIYATGFFQPGIKVMEEPAGDNAIKIVIVVTENPAISGITVAGADKISADRILKVVRDKYKEGAIFKSTAAEEIRRVVVAEYRHRGYSEASAHIETAPAGVAAPAGATAPTAGKNGQVAVRVVVVEGKRRVLDDVIIEGNEHVSGMLIRLSLENKGSWGPITNYYDDEALDADLERIRSLYINQGYLKVKVSLGEFKTGGEGKKAWISPVIKIEEGPRYRVAPEVGVEGATVFAESEIAQMFQGLSGDYYSGKRMRAALDKVSEKYGNVGYPNAQLDMGFDFNDTDNTVKLIIKIKEQNQIRIGRVQVARKMRGEDNGAPWWERWYSMVAPRIKDEAITREVELKSGDVYKTYNEAKTTRRLKNLDVFDKVEVRREPTADPGVNDVVINVDEANETGRLAMGVGYGDVTQGFVFLSYTERNLFGEARDLRGEVLVGMKGLSATIGYLDRHLDDTNFSLGVDAFYERYRRVGYTEQHIGGAVTLGHPLGETDSYHVRVKAYEVVLRPSDDHDATEENLDKQYMVATIRPSVTFDRRDDPYFPTKGYQATFAVEGGYADGPLAKFETNLERYQPLPMDLVWASMLNFGTMPVSADKVGISERYFLGGADSMRGFAYRGAGPKDAKDSDVAIGGASSLLLQNELRYPLSKELSVLAFNDIGFISRDPLQFGSPRVSVGAGARYRIPIATVAVDLGWAAVKDKHDDTEIFHFRLGSRF